MDHYDGHIDAMKARERLSTFGWDSPVLYPLSDDIDQHWFFRRADERYRNTARLAAYKRRRDALTIQ